MVHVLVSRTMRFYDTNSTRCKALRRSVVASLTDALVLVSDIRNHDEVAGEIQHARALTLHAIQDVEHARLASWVGRYDFERGLYAAARQTWEQVLAAHQRLLGEEHPDTLGSLNNIATVLDVQGEIRLRA